MNLITIIGYAALAGGVSHRTQFHFICFELVLCGRDNEQNEIRAFHAEIVLLLLEFEASKQGLYCS